MTRQFQNFQRRFGNAHPGPQLIAVEDAATSATVVRADVLAQEKKELPITEEITLRYVALGVNNPEDIAQYLGLAPSPHPGGSGCAVEQEPSQPLRRSARPDAKQRGGRAQPSLDPASSTATTGGFRQSHLEANGLQRELPDREERRPGKGHDDPAGCA
jgi:hypothetical protein